jgi:hypothetical protein
MKEEDLCGCPRIRNEKPVKRLRTKSCQKFADSMNPFSASSDGFVKVFLNPAVTSDELSFASD